MNWENLAKAAYTKYTLSLAQYPNGVGRPAWEDIGSYYQRAWIEATKEICDIFSRTVTA